MVGSLNIGSNVIISPNVIIATTKHERVNNKVSNNVASVKAINMRDVGLREFND